MILCFGLLAFEITHDTQDSSRFNCAPIWLVETEKKFSLFLWFGVFLWLLLLHDNTNLIWRWWCRKEEGIFDDLLAPKWKKKNENELLIEFFVFYSSDRRFIVRFGWKQVRNWHTFSWMGANISEIITYDLILNYEIFHATDISDKKCP